MKAALAGLKVVEFGHYITAPFAAKLLAGYGAEVIKIEPPGVGDEARRHGPFPRDIPHPEKSGLFLTLNLSKLGITMDPSTPTGRSLFLELLKEADILVHNFRASELEGWGLDDGTVRKANPLLITTSVTVFGDEGPNSDHNAYALTGAAAGGVSYKLGHPERPPLPSPFDRGDWFAGVGAAGATMMAVMARELTGEGQHVDISSAEMYDGYNAVGDMIDLLEGGRLAKRAGRRHPTIYPWVIMPVKDGHFSMITTQKRHWDRFVELMGSPDWAADPRYQDLRKVGARYPEELNALIEPWVSSHSKWDIWKTCRENKIPFQPVQTSADMLDSEHLHARGFWAQVEHPEAGPLTHDGGPVQMSETPWAHRCPAPRLGQHNREVYCGRLGLSAPEVRELYRAGII